MVFLPWIASVIGQLSLFAQVAHKQKWTCSGLTEATEASVSSVPESWLNFYIFLVRLNLPVNDILMW